MKPKRELLQHLTSMKFRIKDKILKYSDDWMLELSYRCINVDTMKNNIIRFKVYMTYNGIASNHKDERVSLIVPWIVGLITFMALEAVAIVYSNVLRDHVNKVSCEHIHKFDSFCKIEVTFYLIRAILNLMHVALAIPINSATFKKSFYSMRRINTYLRSNMVQDRFTNLNIIIIEKSNEQGKKDAIIIYSVESIK
ncbi:Uncharacterized protein FWK35_00004132, partial [Aphis craccivora]